MDDNKKFIRSELLDLYNLETLIKESCTALEKPSDFWLPKEYTRDAIRTAFFQNYNENASGFFATINNSNALETAKTNIKNAKLACYRMLNKKSTLLIAKQQQILKEMNFYIADMYSKNQDSYQKTVAGAKKIEKITQLLNKIKNVH